MTFRLDVDAANKWLNDRRGTRKCLCCGSKDALCINPRLLELALVPDAERDERLVKDPPAVFVRVDCQNCGAAIFIDALFSRAEFGSLIEFTPDPEDPPEPLRPV